jgi:hypothetical protein
MCGLLSESQGQILAVPVLCVPYSARVWCTGVAGLPVDKAVPDLVEEI